ncbi:peroxisome biogenesis factor 1 [Brienomyrus brachyistius]|uniref:peroxisome biogenesis factor 1 n=1 Tax=Brienomyrus brachyistius TaxID=42636 RepID=UPI0020B2BE41|nr:peroxisome biogenesis factor 1 [Brienomyrus brachyistius]
MLTMLGGQGIQPVSVAFNNAKNCFLHLPPALVSQLSLQEGQAVELSGGLCTPVYLSWTRCQHRLNKEEITVEVNRQLGEKLGIKDGQQGFLRPCYQVLSVQQVFVEPLSSDDWEILELHSSALEQKLLDQIRVVFPTGVFPVWVEQRTIIYIRIGSLRPSVPFGRLEQFTELIVSPKLRGDISVRPGTNRFPNTDQNQFLKKQTNFDISATMSSLAGDTQKTGKDSLQGFHEHADGDSQGGITDFKSLIRYMFTGSFSPKMEVPSVPSASPVLRDSVLRVCGKLPPWAGSGGEIHIFPWGHVVEEQDRGMSAVTYGHLRKLHSARELKEEAQRPPEKQSGTKQRASPTGKDQWGPLVVRMVCHCVDQLLQGWSSGKGRALYSGRVWIPEPLRRSLNIELHSAVRIQPLKSTPRIGCAVRLQPLQPLPQHMSEASVQCAFLSWLGTQSNKELAFLTGRSSSIQMSVTEEDFEFSLTVLKPELEAKKSEEVFLLTPSLLQKADIQIVRDVLPVNAEKTADNDQRLTFPSLESLGGVQDIGGAAFEHMAHSLIAGPLSEELVFAGPGLRSGALLIAGPKGSGKTALSKALCKKAAELLDAHVEVIECKTLRGKRVETVRRRLEEAFAQAVWRQPSVVLLDDLDHMMGAAGSQEHERGPETIRSLQLAQSLSDLVDDAVLHGGLVCLMATSQSEHSLHPSLRQIQGSRLFQSVTHIPSPDQAQRAAILSAVIRGKTTITGGSLDTLDLEAVARETEGCWPQDLKVLVERAIHANALHGRVGTASEGCLSTADFLQALRGFRPPSLWHARLDTPAGAGLEQVGGLREARQLLMDTILLPAKYPVLFASLPIRQRSGVLLYGAPGTGKTLLAGAVARESGMNFISIKGPELLSKYIGASEQAVRDVFQRAQAARPCVLFFDEFDSLAPRRGHDSTGVTDRVVNQLLTQLDGVEGLQGVYVLAATSRPDLIDPALLRPGRLDKSLYCPPPDQEARLEILKALTCSVPLAEDVDLEQLAGSTGCFTGADLKALLYNAQLEALHSSLGTCILHDLGSGSDSDVSLSSMIFLNHSSGSDDSAGEGEGGMDQSIVLLEGGELAPEDSRHNIWRLYFGSSYESELGNPSPSELNSQCPSGPNSTTHELTGASLREPGSISAPAFMAALQEGFRELGPEQLERLRVEVADIKASLRGRTTDESLLAPTGPGKPALLICQAHITSALASTRPSIGKQDWKRYTELYEAFGNAGDGMFQGLATIKPGQRVTLA